MGCFQNLDRPSHYAEHKKSKTVITTNVIIATTNDSKGVDPVKDDNIDTTCWNILATKTRGHSSKRLSAIDVAFNEESHDVSAFFCGPMYSVQKKIRFQGNTLQIVACLLNKRTAPDLGFRSLLPRQ